MELLESKGPWADGPDCLLLVDHHGPVVRLDRQQDQKTVNLHSRNEESISGEKLDHSIQNLKFIFESQIRCYSIVVDASL